jgi:hypothetical protein
MLLTPLFLLWHESAYLIDHALNLIFEVNLNITMVPVM